MSNVRFSIITVCFNAEKDIGKTVQSVLGQNFDDYEYIIKDGGSTDGTLSQIYPLVEGYERVTVISEPDRGIYDAMNLSAEHATGEYVFFLNAGDCFCNEEVLAKTDAFLQSNKADVAYGNIIQVEAERRQIRQYGKMYQKKLFYLSGDCICHQAMFAKRDLFDRKFDLEYKVCADREWQLHWLSSNALFLPMFFNVSEVLSDGFSRTHIKDFEKEVKECINIYFPKTAWLYSLLVFMKKNPVMLKILRMAESFFRRKQ